MTAPSSFSAQFVKNTHAEKYLRTNPRAAKAIIEFMYVDDYLNDHETTEEAVLVTREVIKILDDAGFEIRSFQSNSAEILRKLPQDRISSQIVDLDFNFQPGIVTKILGMCWDPSHDAITYKVNPDAFPDSFKNESNKPTKREVLSTVMKIFDPVGHVAHILIRGKMILQRIWVAGTEWDEPIPDEIVNDWRDWVALVKQLGTISIPRSTHQST